MTIADAIYPCGNVTLGMFEKSQQAVEASDQGHIYELLLILTGKEQGCPCTQKG